MSMQKSKDETETHWRSRKAWRSHNLNCKQCNDWIEGLCIDDVIKKRLFPPEACKVGRKLFTKFNSGWRESA